MLSYQRSQHYNPDGKLTASLTPTVDNQNWAPNRAAEIAEYIEAFKFSRPGATKYARYSTYDTLRGHDVLDWVDKKPPQGPFTNPEYQGGVRILILERTYYQPPSFDLTKETYLRIEEAFNLPEQTLFALSNEDGLSWHTLDYDETTGEPTRLHMVIKAPQKFQVGNYGLAFSYDFATKTTTGILHGTGLTRWRPQQQDGWQKQAAAEIFEHINAAEALWTHPLFMPVMQLHHVTLRLDYFCTIVLSDQLTRVQAELGTTRSGRLVFTQKSMATDMPIQKAKLDLKELTIAMSSFMFDAIWFYRVSDWQCSCLAQLAGVLTEFKDVDAEREKPGEMRSRIRFLASLAESIRRHNNALRENGQAEMTVLLSIISQVDNRLNAKMAAAATRDSAAMKTLAFLTTLFLPGTFVATIFSTGMFDWRGGSEGKVVSNLFWVYFALAIPLTLAVGGGWRLWWSWEKKQFDRDVDAEVKAVAKDEDASSASDKPGVEQSARRKQEKYHFFNQSSS